MAMEVAAKVVARAAAIDEDKSGPLSAIRVEMAPAAQSRASEVEPSETKAPEVVAAERHVTELHKKVSNFAAAMREQEQKAKQQVGKVSRRYAYWISAEFAADQVVARYGENSSRARVVRFIQSHKVQTFLICLLIVDVVVVIIELFLDAEYPPCNIIVRDAVSCVGSSGSSGSSGDSSGSGSDDHGRQLSGGHALCPEGYVESGVKSSCDDHKWADVHTAHEGLLWLSISILCLFFVELCTLWVALGFAFARNALYVVDLAVVGLSLLLEIFLGVVFKDQAAATAASMIIIARIWRFVRVIHGVSSSVHERTSHAVAHENAEMAEELQQQVKEMQAALHLAVARNRNKEKRITALRASMQQEGGPESS